jgi:sarcosine oxidase subunit gamma
MTQMEKSSMVDAYLRRSPLAHMHLEARAVADAAIVDSGIDLAEIRHLDMLNLRGDATDAAFLSAVSSVVGAEPTTGPNTSAKGTDGIHILGVGPDEWLIVTQPGKGSDIAIALRTALAGQFAPVVHVGDGRTTIRIAGPNARDVLAKGTAIDLHPAAFGSGQCAQTTIARTSALIHCLEAGGKAPETFDVIVAASFAEYLWTWLEDAAREYGVRVGN